jgi:hypothetical protein
LPGGDLFGCDAHPPLTFGHANSFVDPSLLVAPQGEPDGTSDWIGGKAAFTLFRQRHKHEDNNWVFWLKEMTFVNRQHYRRIVEFF